MANAAKSLIVIAAFLAVHAAQAAGPASRTEPDAVAARPEPDIAPPALDGAQLFATHCAMCHKPAELARRLQGAADPKAARADMAAFPRSARPQRCRRGCGNHRLSREQQGAVAALKRAAIEEARGACGELTINELDLDQ